MIKSFQNLVLAIALIIVGTLISPSVAQAGELGGIDMDRHCTSVGHARGELLEQTPFGWRCIANDGRRVSIDVDSACRSQYNNQRAVGRRRNDTDPYSWYCTDD
ncbi:MAG: hypothetical protein ACFCUV_12560 [Rivularia sp. (in: cyanobacteria)]